MEDPVEIITAQGIRYEMIGQGGFGAVAKVCVAQPYARKCFRHSNHRDAEYNIACIVNHRNIVHCIAAGTLNATNQLGKTFGSDYIDYEFLAGFSLQDLLYEHSVSLPQYVGSEEQLRLLIQGGLDGLNYLHNTANIAHNDIKPGNLMITLNKLVIIDLGIACKNPPKVVSSFVGTIGFQCPEYWCKQSFDQKSADIFAYGLCIFKLVTGRTLYGVPQSAKDHCDRWQTAACSHDQMLHLNEMIKIMKNVVETERPHLSNENSKLRFHVGAEIHVLVSRMIERNPQNRGTARILSSFFNSSEAIREKDQKIAGLYDKIRGLELTVRDAKEAYNAKQSECKLAKDALEDLRKDLKELHAQAKRSKDDSALKDAANAILNGQLKELANDLRIVKENAAKDVIKQQTYKKQCDDFQREANQAKAALQEERTVAENKLKGLTQQCEELKQLALDGASDSIVETQAALLEVDSLKKKGLELEQQTDQLKAHFEVERKVNAGKLESLQQELNEFKQLASRAKDELDAEKAVK